MKYILTYGTLRHNDGNPDYNFGRFGGNQKQLNTFRLSGFKMFDLGSYPCIVSATESDYITVELHEIEEHAYNQITRMEEGAGYKSTNIETNGVSATIYYYHQIPYYSIPIPGGDWAEYKKS